MKQQLMFINMFILVKQYIRPDGLRPVGMVRLKELDTCVLLLYYYSPLLRHVNLWNIWLLLVRCSRLYSMCRAAMQLAELGTSQHHVLINLSAVQLFLKEFTLSTCELPICPLDTLPIIASRQKSAVSQHLSVILC